MEEREGFEPTELSLAQRFSRPFNWPYGLWRLYKYCLKTLDYMVAYGGGGKRLHNYFAHILHDLLVPN